MKGTATVVCLAAMALWIGACDEGEQPASNAADAAVGGDPDATALPDDFFEAKPPAFSSTDDEPKTIQVSASGEALSQMGFRYDNSPGSDPVFVDGWDVSFERYLVVIDRVLVSQPGSDPDKRGQLGGTVVEQRGPWVVDLHKRGPLVGAGGPPETAMPLAVLHADFETSRGYAFSYQTAPASYAVRNTNLVEADRDALQQMIDHGWVKYIAGTARYRGRPPSDSVDPTFQDYPTQVHFAFGFADPAEYVNCHNPEIGEQDAPANRGVRPSAEGSVRAQLTFHSDHFFWDQADVEGTPLRFDALAARADGFGADVDGSHELRLDQLSGVKPSALMDAAGKLVRDRGEQTERYHSDLGAPPVYATNGVAEIDDLRSFVVYNNRGQGHLNSDGLCLVVPTAELSF
jgi:hypothetical protein